MHICNNTRAKYIIIKYKNILINAISNTNNTNIIIPYTTSRRVPDGVSGTRRRVGYPTPRRVPDTPHFIEYYYHAYM